MRAEEAEEKTVGILSKKVCTYRDLEKELHDPSINLTLMMDRLKRRKAVKHIGLGNRPVFFTKESQRREADIKSLGKHAWEVYDFLEGGGAYRTSDLKLELGIVGNSFSKHTRNLVANGYVKMIKASDQMDGDIYYVSATKQQIRLASLGRAARGVYKAIDAKGLPMFSGEIAEEMDITIFNASGIAKRLVKKGYVYESNLSAEGREKMRLSCFYTRKSQGPLANIMSISPQYGVTIYKTLQKGPATTSYVSKKTGIERGQAFQVLESMEREGLAKKKVGRPDTWRLLGSALGVSFRDYSKHAHS